MSKTIEIKKVYIRNLVISFLLGFTILYSLEHFGTFRFNHNYSPEYSGKPSLEYQVPYSTKVSKILYKTYFDNTVETNGNGFTISDLVSSDSTFNTYSSKSYYYTQATIKDFKYGLYISLGLFFITLLITNFKIKLT